MLGFSSAAFYPRPRPTQDLSAEPRKPRLPKDATSRRFLVRRQGYLRNSRRIFEIGSQAVVVLGYLQHMYQLQILVEEAVVT